MDLKKLTALSEALRSRTAEASRVGNKSWYRITNQSDGAPAKVYIYDMIGEWGVSAQDFVNELAAVSSPSIDLHINSEGGQVFDGIAIYTALRNHPANVTAYVDALAASAASFIVQAADNRVMEPNARMMIHDASGVVVGNAADARSLADLLEDTSDNIASIYAERSGTPTANWRAAMQKDSGAGTWYSAQEAVDAGLADSIATKAVDNAAQRRILNETPEPEKPKTWSFSIADAIKNTKESAA